MFEADIEACFDQIDHTALMDRVRNRVGDKRVLALVKAFLRAGVLSEDGALAGNDRPAHPKAGSSHRCWPTSPCPCWTSTSPRSGKRSARNGLVPSAVAPGNRS